MAKIEVKRHDLSDLANLDELNYRENIQPVETANYGVDEAVTRIRSDKRLEILPWLQTRGVRPRGEGLDLGAGNCWLTAQLSTFTEVTAVHALEFSDRLVTQMAPGVIDRLGGDPDKITFHIGDIHHLSMFDDGSLDFVAASAVLHHSSNLETVLRESRRVLRPGGLMFAIMEPGIPKIITPFTRNMGREHFGDEEKEFGVKEQTFYQKEWRQAYENCGFDVRFLSMFVRTGRREKLIRYSPLRWTNGFLFWQKAIVAYSR
jgi:ubiquinone/menaquinone biosynthesis C-methylase UbiE